MSAATELPALDVWRGAGRVREQADRAAARRAAAFDADVTQILEQVREADRRGTLPPFHEPTAAAAAVALVDAADAPRRTPWQVAWAIAEAVLVWACGIAFCALMALVFFVWLCTPAGAVEPTPSPVTEVLDVARPSLAQTGTEPGPLFVLGVIVGLAGLIGWGVRRVGGRR